MAITITNTEGLSPMLASFANALDQYGIKLHDNGVLHREVHVEVVTLASCLGRRADSLGRAADSQKLEGRLLKIGADFLEVLSRDERNCFGEPLTWFIASRHIIALRFFPPLEGRRPPNPGR